MATPETIMFIRHGEKPSDHGTPHGVDHDGSHDPHSLSVRGWTRAGALAGLLSRVPTKEQPSLAVPKQIYATKSSHDYESKREEATATPLAQRLDLKVDTAFNHGEEKQLCTEVLEQTGPVLVVWHHGSMGSLLPHFPIKSAGRVPKQWPEDRFDLIWVLTRDGDGYEFTEVNQSLLAGDA